LDQEHVGRPHQGVTTPQVDLRLGDMQHALELLLEGAPGVFLQCVLFRENAGMGLVSFRHDDALQRTETREQGDEPDRQDEQGGEHPAHAMESPFYLSTGTRSKSTRVMATSRSALGVRRSRRAALRTSEPSSTTS